MTRRRLALLAALTVPAIVLAVFGTTHPTNLTDATALYWRNLHIALLPIFPLLGFAPWLITRRRTEWLGARWLTPAVAILGFVFGVFYTALDVLAGIGAGGLKLDGMGMATGIGIMYQLARALGGVGALAFVAACVVSGVTVVRSVGAPAIVGTVLVVAGALLLFRNHIYLPWGVLGQVLLAIGWAALLFVLERRSTAASGALRLP